MSNVGIDVAKERLDVAVRPSREVFSVTNDDAGRRDLRERLVKLQPERIVLEPTGGYEALVVQELASAKLPVVVVNARQVRQFAQALGRLAKTDRIDADVLAHFGEALKPEVRPLPDQARLELEALVTRRQQLVGMRADEMRRKHTARNAVRPNIEAVIAFLSKQIDDLDQDLKDKVKSSDVWREQDDLLQSMRGVGSGLSRALTAQVPELGKLNRKQIAALIGIAPLNNDSGRRQGKRTTWGGRAAVRAVLYMATLTACRCNDVIRSFYERLVSKGKPHAVAMTACMRKMLVILNAMVRDKQPWTPQLES